MLSVRHAVIFCIEIPDESSQFNRDVFLAISRRRQAHTYALCAGKPVSKKCRNLLHFGCSFPGTKLRLIHLWMQKTHARMLALTRPSPACMLFFVRPIQVVHDTYLNCSSIRILKLNEKLLSNAVASAMTTSSTMTTPAAAAMSYGINIRYTTAVAQFSHRNNECRTRVQACVRSRGAYLILSAFISNSATHSRANKWLSVCIKQFRYVFVSCTVLHMAFSLRFVRLLIFVVVSFLFGRVATMNTTHNVIMIAINVVGVADAAAAATVARVHRLLPLTLIWYFASSSMNFFFRRSAHAPKLQPNSEFFVSFAVDIQIH